MILKKVLLAILFLSICGELFVFTQNADRSKKYSLWMAQSVMQRNPETYGEWDYVTGTVLRGFEALWKTTGKKEYFDYIQKTVDQVIAEDGSISGYSKSDYNIDEIKEGCSVLFLYEQTNETKYQKVAENLVDQMREHPRTSDGGFWHKQKYPYQMWLDGLYMGSPFLARYGKDFNQSVWYDDVINQIQLIHQHTRDTSTGLYYHGWDESREQEWANPETGTSPAFWGRAMGWYAISIVDVLDHLPADYQGRDSVVDIMKQFATAIMNYQDDTTGLWWQVIDRPGDEGNYLESSVSCMFTYALAKAVRKGYIDTLYRSVARKAYQGIINHFIREDQDGAISLTQTCRTAGLGYGRDGTYDYYVNETTIVSNDGKAVGPFILASLEMEHDLYPPSNFHLDTMYADSLLLKWEDESNNEDGFIIKRENPDQSELEYLSSSNQWGFCDTNIDPLNSYQYQLKVYNETDTISHPFSIRIKTLSESGAPSQASSPAPGNNQNHVSTDVTLEWEPGFNAENHHLYWGENEELDSSITLENNNYTLPELAYQTQYFWRIDEANENGITEGDLWQFTTQEKPGIISYWSFDNISDSLILDQEKFSNNGIYWNMNNEVLGDGVSYDALYFNGTDQYIHIPHNKSLDFGEKSFTLSFWFKQNPDSIREDKEYRYLIKGSHIASGQTNNTGKRYEVFLNPGSKEFRFVVDDNITKSRAIGNMEDFVTGEWVYVTAIRDTSLKQLSLYANAELKATGNDRTGDISQEEDLFIGYCKDFDSYYKGFIDEIRLYNCVLSQQEIDSLYEMDKIISDDPINGKTNIKEKRKARFRTYPNPFNDVLNFCIFDANPGNYSIKIYNTSGYTVFCKNHYFTGIIKEQKKIILPELKTGVYIFTVYKNRKQLYQKLIIKK